MKELLSIKEFSKLSGIEVTTLRYWDDIGLFSPVTRDEDNNYRYYSPQQVIAVNFITVLSNLRVPLKTIRGAKPERDPESIISLIEQQENYLDSEMRRIRDSYSIIHTRRDLIKQGLRADPSKISVSEFEERSIIIGPRNVFPEGKGFYEPFMNFCRQAQNLRINLSYPIGGMHNSMEAFVSNPSEPDHFFSLDPTGNSCQAAGRYMVGYARGFYGEMDNLPERMMAYAEDHALTFSGPLYAVYLHDEICQNDPAEFLAQISVAVTGHGKSSRRDR